MPLAINRPGWPAVALTDRQRLWELLARLSGFQVVPERLAGYGLRLADGSSWWIAGCPPVTAWTRNLAAILGLKPGEPGDSGLMLLFSPETGALEETMSGVGFPDWLPVQGAFLKAWYHRDLPQVLCAFEASWAREFPQALLWNYMAFIYRESARRGGLPFHGALVEFQGQGVILAAPGGVGKSTCCLRLTPPWRALSDDEALAVLTDKGRYAAHPFPTWSNFIHKRQPVSWPVATSLPLAGIFYLEQAATDEVVPLTPARAALAATDSAQQVLVRFLLWSLPEEARQLRARLFANACQLAARVPAFRLKVSLEGRFWEKMEAALNWR